MSKRWQRAVFTAAVVLVGCLLATPSAAQCQADVSVYADGAYGNYNSSGEAQLTYWGIGYDYSSCYPYQCNHGHYLTATVTRQPDQYVMAVVYGTNEAYSSTWVTPGAYRIEIDFLVWCDCANNYVANVNAQQPVEVQPQCGDERGNMIAEYAAYGVNLSPTCNDFRSSGGTTHFSWSEYNGGFQQGSQHNPWGIVTSGLESGLEATRSNYNKPIHLESGYRCPKGNTDVGSEAPTTSWHMHGRAADLFSCCGNAWTEAEFNLMKDAALDASPTEAFNWNTYPDHHFHVAW